MKGWRLEEGLQKGLEQGRLDRDAHIIDLILEEMEAGVLTRSQAKTMILTAAQADRISQPAAKAALRRLGR